MDDHQIDMQALLSLEVSPGQSIRQYLHELLVVLWREQDGFSGKPPFGESDWPHDLYIPLAQARFIGGRFDPEDESWEDIDTIAGDRLIEHAIYWVFYGTRKPERQRRIRQPQ